MEPGDRVVPRSGLPTVSALVPSYRRRTQLETCVRALLADPATSEVVVAIDGSGDGSLELTSRLAAEDGRVVAFEQVHAGTNAARAAAAQMATGEVLLFMDDDVVAGKELVTGHALRHRDARRLVVVGYMPVVAIRGDRASRVLASIYAREYEAHCEEIEADPRLILLHLWGGNVSLRREDFFSVDAGPWELEHEDQYLGVCCYKAGLTGVFDRSLYAEHQYQRDADGFLRSARNRGEATWRLHVLYPQLLGVLNPDWASTGLGVPAGWLVRWAATPQRSRHVTGPLVLSARAAHAIGFTGFESAAYRLARRVELQVGTDLSIATGVRAPGHANGPGASSHGVESL